MDLIKKKAFRAKYLLAGNSNYLNITSLSTFCLREAKSQLPDNTGSNMIIDKSTKLAGEMIRLFNNKELSYFLSGNRLLMRKIRKMTKGKRKKLSRNAVINAFKKLMKENMKAIMMLTGNI